MSKLKGALDRYFKISERGSNFRTEIFAGLTTFLAMCYILVVNPNQILYGGAMDPMWSSVFIATALGAFIGTLLMALFARVPYAQAPGMGLNAMIGSVIGGMVGAYGFGFEFSFGNAMAIVLISGVIFLLLSVIPVKRDLDTGKLVSIREEIFNGIPKAIKLAIPVGIGLFIAYIGFQNAKIIGDNQWTLTDLVALNNPDAWKLGLHGEVAGAAIQAMVCIFGLLVIAVTSHFNVKGSVIIGILAATILAMPLGVVNFDVIAGKTPGVSWKFWESFGNFFSMDPSNGGAFLACFVEGFKFPAGSAMTVIMLIISFAMIDMFDTMGTILGCATKAGLLDEKGTPLAYGQCMYADSIATVVGACLGTSTVTTFVESGTGVAEGAKTGFTALVVAVLFLLSIFLLPVFAFIPSAAAASALVYVGVVMMSTVVNVDFKDVRVSVPAFLTIIVMPLGYSITDGIGIGILSYCIIAIICYAVDLIKYAAAKKSAPKAEQPASAEESAEVETAEAAVADKADADKEPSELIVGEIADGQAKVAKPEWPVSIVTGIIAILFIVYFFVPTTF